MSFTRPTILLSFALAAFGLAPIAHALPSIQDYWRIGCTGEPVSEKTLAKAEAKSSSGAGKLAYACQLSAMESKRHEAAMVKFAEGGSKGAAPVVNHNGSMAIVKQVAAQLEAQTKQKKDPKNMYYLGLALALQGDDWAVNKFDEVARGDSDYAGDAELGMAEFYFDKKGAAASVDQYKKVLKQKNKFNNAYARYKMAWINYAFGAQGKNRAQQKSAITQLASLSASLKKAKGAEASLARVLKDDILALCVDYGDQADAQKILQSVGASDVYGAFLERAAYVKMEQNDAAGSYKLFQLALKEAPLGPTALQMSLNMAGLAAQLKNTPLILYNVKMMQKTYLNKKSKWAKKQKKPELKKVAKQLETVFFDYAAGLDQAARADQKPASIAASEQMYQIFLKQYPKSPKTYDAKYYYGQMLYLAKKYTESATTLYAMVKENPKGKYTKDTMDIMVTAAQYAVDSDKNKNEVMPKPGTIKKKMKIPANKQAYADALEMYTRMTPKNANTPAMLYASGTVYYDYGDYKEGNKRYYQYINAYPTHDFAKLAAARMLEYGKLQADEEENEKLKNQVKSVQGMAAAPELQQFFVVAKKEKGEKGEKKKKKKKKKKDSEDGEGSGEGSEAVAEEGSGSDAEAVPASEESEPAEE